MYIAVWRLSSPLWDLSDRGRHEILRYQKKRWLGVDGNLQVRFSMQDCKESVRHERSMIATGTAARSHEYSSSTRNFCRSDPKERDSINVD